MEDFLPGSEILPKSINYTRWDKKLEKIFFTDKFFLDFLSKKISETRKEKDLTIEELATKANVSDLQVQNIENKIGEVDIEVFEKVLQALDLKIKVSISFDQ